MTTTPWERQHAQLAARYGTTDIDEAIRREMTEGASGMRRCQWPDCDEDISSRDPSAKYCQEHSKNKYTQALSRRKAKAMSEERKCEWPGCDVDISDAHPLAKLCDEHKAEKKRQKAREYQKRAYAKKCEGKKASKPGAPVVSEPKALVEPPATPEPPVGSNPGLSSCISTCICYSCGLKQEDTCWHDGQPLTYQIVECANYKKSPLESDPRPAPEGHGPAIVTPAPENKLPFPVKVNCGMQDIMQCITAIRSWDTDAEAQAFMHGFFMGRAPFEEVAA